MKTKTLNNMFQETGNVFMASNVSDEKKVSHMLSGIGAKTYAVLRDLLAPSELKDSEFPTIKQKLVKHYKSKPPVIAQRFIFDQRTQKSGETINQFIIEL